MAKDAEKLRDQIKALLQRTIENGCTANEASIAIQAAMKLAAKLGLTVDDFINSPDEIKFTTRDIFSGASNYSPIDFRLSYNIGKFCGVKIRNRTDSDGYHIDYFGDEASIDLAVFIRSVCLHALEREWRWEQQNVPTGHVSEAYNAMIRGFCKKMASRLAFIQQNMPTGNDLIVVKNALLERKAEEAGFVQPEAAPGYGRKSDPRYYAMGAAAAAGVDIGRPMARSNAKAIEHKR